MPDIFNNISANNNPEVPSEINIQKVNLDSPITGQIDLSQPVKSTGNPLLDMLGNIRADLSKQPWVQSEQYNYPLYKIPLKDAERFNNPAIGYDPFDPNLETKYGEAQGTVSRIFNRLVKTGAGVGVSILNAGKDIQDLFSGQSGVDDKFTTDTDNWLKRLDQVNLPNYKTQYQADHPVMSYFNPLHLTSFLDNWGGAGQALAPIAGAIATSVLTDIPLGIATDGIADNLLLPKQLSRIMEGVGDLSKGLTSSKEDFNAFTNLLNNSEDLSEGVRKALTLAKNFKYGANTGRYLASVGLSSYVQSMMMGNETYNEVKNDVLSQYKDEYGNVNASGDVVSRAEKTAKDAGDAVVAPAFAFMTISSAFGLSSILRPAQAAIDATEKALSKEASVVLNPNNINEFTVTSKQYGKGLMGLAQKSLNRSGFLVDNLRQAATMGGFYVSSDATKNYYEHKFSLNGTEDAMSLATYYMQSLGKLFTTPEGQEQLAIGFVGGALEHIAKGINNRVKGIDNSADAFAAKIAQGLNNYKATSLFDVSRDESISSADIVKQMQDAANSGDIFRYKNLQHTALFNFVSSGEKLHQFEARINQLEALKSLNKENFETLFNIDFNDANKKTVSEFVDATINKAKTIKEDIRKVNGAFAENPFSPKTQASDHLAYDHYKDEVAFAITKQKDFLKRAQQLKENSLNKVPAANFEDIVGLSSEEGVKGTVSNFEKKIEDLKNSEKLAGDNEDLKSGFKEERDFLEDKVKDLRGTLKKYDPDQYLITLRELYNYYGNGNSVKGNFDIHPIDVLSVFNNGQDAYNLAQGNKDIVRYYRELTGKTGFKNFKADFINHLTSYYDRITVNPDGTFKVKDLPVEEPVQNFVNDYLGVNTPVEAASKIDAGDKEFIAKVIDPNYEKSNDPNSLGNRIASGKEAITPELKDKAKLRVAEDFKNAPVPTNPTPPGTPTTKAQQRDEFTKQQMKDLGISVVEPSTDIETVYQDQDAAITTALLKPTSEQTEATDNTVQKLWKNMMSPIKLLNKIFSPKADDVPFNENIRQLLFSVPSVESFKDNLHAVITETPENFKTSKRTRVVGSKGLYRTSYELNITLYNGDKAIGLLHPPSSLEFKRGDSYHPISELKDANEYVEVTGNNIVSFDAFRKNVDAYQKAYDELVREHKGKKAGEPATTEVSNGKFLSLFSPYISYGSRFESDTEAKSTAIKDLKYQGKGSAILSFPVVFNEETGEWARSAKPAILNLSELEGDEPFHVLQFVDNNIDKFHQHDARYFYLSKLPNGKFEDISIIRARPAQESEKGVAQAYDIIKQAISHPEGADLKDVNQQLRESLYLSDRNTGKGKGSGKVKGNQMRLEINDNGDLQLNIFNTHNKIRKNVVIPKDIVLSTNNFDELVSIITKRLDDAKKTSHDLGERLRPILTKESFKKSILDDENAPLEQIKANLKASVLPEVFQDYTLELMPNSGIDKAIPAPAEKVTEPITPVAPEATVQPEVTPAPAVQQENIQGKIDDIEKRRDKKLSSLDELAKKEMESIENSGYSDGTKKLQREERLQKQADRRKNANAEYDTELEELKKEQTKDNSVVEPISPTPTGALSTDTGALTDEASALPEQPVEELQPIKVETTPATQEEPAVQEPEAEQYVPQVKVPEPEVPIWKAPVPTIEGENKIKYISAIQNAYRNGSYDDAVRNGELNEAQLREIFKSAGLGDNTADRVIFRATNKGLQYSIDDIKEMTPDTSDNEFQMVSNYFLDSGKLEEAIKNDMIDPESAKNILDNTITTSTEVKTKKEALQKTVEDKLAEQEKQKKEAEQAKLEEEKKQAELPNKEKEPVVDEPRTPTEAEVKQTEEPAPVDKTEEERIAEANKRIEELKAQLTPERKWVKVSNDDGIRAEELPADLSNAERANLNSRRTSLVNISERLRKVFPDIPMDIIYAPDVEWKGRIKDGRVEINLHKATLDTPIHEMLHPFILALRNSNYELYSNLIDEMRFGHNGELAGYIDKVKADKDYANLKPEEAEEEALIRYLSDDMSSMLDANGQLNEKKVEEKYGNSAFQKVYTWVQDRIRDLWKSIVDAFNGTTSSGEQRSSSAKKKAIEKFKDLQYFTYNFEKGTLTAYTGDVSNQNTTKKITTEDGEEKSVQKKVEPNRSWRIATDLSETGIQELKDKGFTDATIKQLKDIVNDYQSRPEAKKALKINKFALGEDAQKAPVKEEQQFKLPVSEIPVDFTLKNIADVIGMQQKLSFDLSSEQGAIDKLEAYQHADKIDFEEWKKKLQIRLAQLEDTSKRRIIDADIVQGNLIGVRRVLRDFDGVEALTQYVGQGIRGLNAGAWLVRDISETIKRANAGETAMYDDKGKRTWVKSNTKVLDEALIHDLSNNLLQARTLLSFYDDVATLYTIYHDEFDKDELNHFNAVYKEADLKRKAIGNVGTKLTAEWLYPTLEKSQESLPADKRLSKADLERRLRFADQDISSISYWMGSVINGRDPVNAIFAVLVKDKLNQHHGEEAELNATTRRLYDDFQKRTGTLNTAKAYEEYVKKNFLRKAKYWDVVGYDKEKGEAKHAYKEAWAYNEKHYWDLYYDDLRLFKEGLEAEGRPATDKQWEEYNQKVTNWIDANHPEISGTHKYDNPLFDKLMADPYYNHLYSTYKTSNAKYGERRLDHGIIQQAYKKANSLAEFKNDIQGLPDYFKKTFTDKTKSAGEKVESITGDLGTYLFDQREYMREQDLNLDGSYYRGVKSPFTHIINEENLDFRLNESLIGFSQAANDFAALRSIQAETENLKMLMESNPKLGIAGRQIASRDRSGKILFDRFAKRPENEFASKLNKQLISSINDIFYGESEFQAGVNIGPVHLNLNALGKRLGFGTALFTMAGNLFSGISNVTIGNVMSLGEAVGGRYYKPKNWLWAQKEYAVNLGSFAHDVINPVKSKVTQLAIRYDAIQGEFRDKYGKNITGNVINKYATGDTFFILMHAGEHQIQLTGMLALMDATKVKLKDGSTVSLYDAYQANDKGFFKLRNDAEWSDQDNVDFMKKLHGISRDLNGNYASFDKSMLQRYWVGKLAMQYRKYLYPAWRARFGGERVDYERGDIQQGYYRTFLKKFWNDMKDYNFNVLQSVPKSLFGKAESDQVAYARRKTAFDVLTMVGVTMLAASLAGLEKQNQDGTDDKAQERLLLTALRLRSDLSQYTWTLPQEVYRDISNPSASLKLIQTYADVMSQFFTDPTEDYKQNGSGYQRGDNKLGTKLEKAIPLWRQFQRWRDPKDQVKYYNLINKDVKPSNMVSENSK